MWLRQTRRTSPRTHCRMRQVLGDSDHEVRCFMAMLTCRELIMCTRTCTWLNAATNYAPLWRDAHLTVAHTSPFDLTALTGPTFPRLVDLRLAYAEYGDADDAHRRDLSHLRLAFDHLPSLRRLELSGAYAHDDLLDGAEFPDTLVALVLRPPLGEAPSGDAVERLFGRTPLTMHVVLHTVWRSALAAVLIDMNYLNLPADRFTHHLTLDDQ